jgi:hypothetical protein
VARDRRRRASATVVAGIVLALAGLSPQAVAADPDTTSPTVSVELWAADATTVTFKVSASDANGIAGVWLSCDDGATWVMRPYQSTLAIPLREGGLGCIGYTSPGQWSRWIKVEVRDPAGNAFAGGAYVALGPTFELETPLPAVTGHPFTITPILPDDYVIPAPGGCRWEFRWGDTRSLDTTDHNETYASHLFDIPAVGGKCAPWTFTLPWVPVRQYEVNVQPFTIEPDGGTMFIASAQKRFSAAVDSTQRLITSSSLPIVQVLPSTYTPIVGQPITYTRYLIGGATNCCGPRWFAWQGEGDHPNTWSQTGGSTFTITPREPGNIEVGWDRAFGDWRLGALYDPPVRYRDTTRPNTTAPVQRIGGALLGAAVPVTLTWGGTDRGWGVASYQLQGSVNGGPWTTISLPTAKATSIVRMLTPGVAVRYRVRAIDKARNVGYWDYGPTFRSAIAADSHPAVVSLGPWAVVGDATAHGGAVHESSTAGARATVRFTGRDVAWVAEVGPGHGKARVYIDGALITTVDLNATVAGPRRVVFRRHWSTSGVHTIRIVVLGSGVVDVDAIAILR